jgi:TonB family protein
MPNVSALGDPKGVDGPPSNGTGSGGGIGSGSGGGVGSGRGPGVGPGWGGGIGGGAYRVGGGVSAPRPLFSPDPEYSEEARKAKFQGVVVLWVVVGPDGRVHDMRVSRSLGLGLDEKAMEAVKQWKFDPARKDGQPVAVQINVEVNFRLY